MGDYSKGSVEAAKELQTAMRQLNEAREAFEGLEGDGDELVRSCALYQQARRRVGRAFRKVKAAEAWEARAAARGAGDGEAQAAA